MNKPDTRWHNEELKCGVHRCRTRLVEVRSSPMQPSLAALTSTNAHRPLATTLGASVDFITTSMGASRNFGPSC